MFRRKKAAAAAEQRADVCVNGVVCRYGASWSGNVPSDDVVLVRQCGRWNRKRKVLLGSDLRPRVSRSAREEIRKAESFDGRRGGKFYSALRVLFEVQLINIWADHHHGKFHLSKNAKFNYWEIFFSHQKCALIRETETLQQVLLAASIMNRVEGFFSRGGLQLFTLHA